MDGVGTAIDEYDQAALAEAIDELMQDPLRAIAFSDKGRQRYEKVFHPQVIRRRLLELLEEVTV
jgi:glycosyltransferase involved in cell wall biosynthesis